MDAVPADITDWDWLFARGEVTVEEVYDRYHAIDKSTLEPHLDCLAAMSAAASLGCENWVVTGRGYSTRTSDETLRWLSKFSVPYRSCSFVPAKEKAGFAQRHSLTISVEDHAETAIALHQAGVHSLLVWTPYNRNAPPYLHVGRDHLPGFIRRAVRSYRSLQLPQ